MAVDKFYLIIRRRCICWLATEVSLGLVACIQLWIVEGSFDNVKPWNWDLEAYVTNLAMAAAAHCERSLLIPIQIIGFPMRIPWRCCAPYWIALRCILCTWVRHKEWAGGAGREGGNNIRRRITSDRVTYATLLDLDKICIHIHNKRACMPPP